MSPRSKLNTEPNLPAPDDCYEMLVNAHRDLDPDQSRLVNAKLVLLLANHVGDISVIAEAISAACEGITLHPAQADLALTA